MKTKYTKLSKELRRFIVPESDLSSAGKLGGKQSKQVGIVSAYAERTLRHCNGGATLQAAQWLKTHLDNGGKLVVSVAGALSSFQVGIMLAELIRQGYELGEADDIVFKKTNSKQQMGAIGLMTQGVIDRIEGFKIAVILALIPFKNPDYY